MTTWSSTNGEPLGARTLAPVQCDDRRTSWTLTKVTALCAVLLVGCSDGEPAQKKTASDSSSATSELVISQAIDRVGPSRVSLGSIEDNSALLTTILGIRGVGRSEIDCYLDKVVPVFGSEKFAKLTVAAIQKWTKITVLDLPPEVREDSATCLTQASNDRRKADEIAPDLDIALARTVVRKSSLKQAVGVDLTEGEAECYVEASLDHLTDDQFRDGLAGKLTREIRDPEAAVRKCVTAARREELREPLLAGLDAQRQREEADRKIAESKLNAEVNDQLTTTTVD